MNRAFNRSPSPQAAGRRAAGRLLTVLALGLALAGCGRRGELEAPPGSTPQPVARQSVVGQSGESTVKTIDAVTPQTRSNVVPPRQPFFLDKLL